MNDQQICPRQSDEKIMTPPRTLEARIADGKAAEAEKAAMEEIDPLLIEAKGFVEEMAQREVAWTDERVSLALAALRRGMELALAPLAHPRRCGMSGGETVAVTQADRECAAAHYVFVQSRLKAGHAEDLQQRTVEEILAGRWNRDESVQAFARHRLATAPDHALLREAVEALERQTENMAFVLNRIGIPGPWYDKLTKDLSVDRATLAKLTAAIARGEG